MVLILSTIVITLLFDYLFYKKIDNLSKKRAFEKFFIEIIGILLLIFTKKFNLRNLIVSITVIVLLNYIINSDLYQSFSYISKKEDFVFSKYTVIQGKKLKTI